MCSYVKFAFFLIYHVNTQKVRDVGKNAKREKLFSIKFSFLVTMVSKFVYPSVMVFGTNKDFQNFLINFDILKKKNSKISRQISKNFQSI